MFSSAKSNGVHGASPATLSKSLRFRSSASAYLNRTFGTPTNNLKYTLSLWVKRGTLGTQNILFDGGDTTGNNNAYLQFNSSDQLNLAQSLAGTANINLITTQIFRDPSAWYHIVLAVDTTQATSTDRVKIYINNVQITSFGTAVYPTLNLANQVNVASRVHNIGKLDYYALYLDAYLTDVYFIDGQQLTPSSFGATNATTGQWSPATYSGTYGTNGFHLTFANTTSTTTLGYDTSGNSNNWTTNNISLTAGSTYDSMNDVPTLTSATASNYATWNPLKTYNATFTSGNLNASVAATSTTGADVGLGTFGMSSGKWYWEVTCNSITAAMVGISDANAAVTSSSVLTANGWAYYSGGNKYNNNSGPAYGASFTNGDIIGVALDMDTGTLGFYKNGTSQGTAYSTSLTGKTMIAMVGTGSGSVTQTYSANFGQQPFTYTPPSGYNALNTYNLPTPSIAQGNKYMDATLYTGNGSSQTITNSGVFQPDFVWAKGRSGATSNILVNAVTGANQFLLTDSTQAEATSSALVSAFTSSGFSIGSSTSINNSSSTYVAWQWKANGSGSSNTNGSITSTVSANTTSGFSVVTYTGTGTAGTIGHGLGVAPSMIIVKSRSATGDWPVYHSSLGNGSYALLDTTAASAASSTIWNATSPTSSVFSVGINTVSNTVTVTYVAYCFAQISGFSAFGSYTGNGSATGPFIYTGFQPKYLLVKRTNLTSDWYIWDSVRNTFNIVTNTLLADTAGAETSASSVNILSNGFQCVSSTVVNANGDTYIYAAFASNPFAYSNAF